MPNRISLFDRIHLLVAVRICAVLCMSVRFCSVLNKIIPFSTNGAQPFSQNPYPRIHSIYPFGDQNRGVRSEGSIIATIIYRKPIKCKLTMHNKIIQQVLKFDYLNIVILSDRNLTKKIHMQTNKANGHLQDIMYVAGRDSSGRVFQF